MVGSSKKAISGMSMPITSPMRTITSIAFSESPPISKKFASISTSGRRSTSVQIPAIAFSDGLRLPFSSSATAARCATVGSSKKAISGMSTPITSPMRMITSMAFMESPPISKKFASISTSGRRSTSAQIRASASSAALLPSETVRLPGSIPSTMFGISSIPYCCGFLLLTSFHQSLVIEFSVGCLRHLCHRQHFHRRPRQVKNLANCLAGLYRVRAVLNGCNQHIVAAVAGHNGSKASRKDLLHVIEIEAFAKHLLNALQPPRDVVVAVGIVPRLVACPQHAVEFIAFRQVIAALRVAHHHVRPLVNQLFRGRVK